MQAFDLINAVLAGADPTELVEDQMLLQTQHKEMPDPKLRKVARKRYRDNRQTYRKAQDRWVNSAEGRSFYRRLGRRNSRRYSLGLNTSIFDEK
jgi:hypothetical protein